MKKILLLFVACAFSILGMAQTMVDSSNIEEGPLQSDSPLFGYLSYSDALEAVPGYEDAQYQLTVLESKYIGEIRRVEMDFNTKYEEFLEGQAGFPETILKKRQTELQELMDKNIQFRDESHRLLKSAESDMYAPLHEKLRVAIAAVAERLDLAFILNTDNNMCPYISKDKGIDIIQQVKECLAQ